MAETEEGEGEDKGGGELRREKGGGDEMEGRRVRRQRKMRRVRKGMIGRRWGRVEADGVWRGKVGGE